MRATELRLHMWSPTDFAESRAVWNALLESSEADPLFMSWEWQYRWWQHHAESLGAALQLLAFHLTDGSLVGLAPFYAHDVRTRGMRLRRLELIGVTWRSGGGVFSEYLDVIARREHANVVLSSVAHWLEANTSWDDLAMPCIRRNSLMLRLAREYLAQFAYVREVDQVASYSIRLPTKFGDYTQRLNANTRRKLLNQRRKLRDPSVELAGEGDISQYLESLRVFESARWGTTNDTLHRFNLDFAASMVTIGGLRLTRLTTGGRTLSVMLNVRVNGTEYYLQSAFDPTFACGISPGYLHFGYVIESACEDGLEIFDLLAGSGRHRNYKQDLVGSGSPLTCCHAVRPTWLRALYWTYDRCRDKRGFGR